ncbi:transglutaminase family protein [Telmatocola sphagniphila]|uniref:Transglutaminase family protein n=1 Tax=Telmatocola sphagniphila TaxID=1123043 RepID=A0A8E6B4D3_9BACT|nr:transglutaminase family protein [Telmatocola sphagniphila]QVL31950.1 transglutaminase family protein [Telmatocola sphagniphila]
MSIRVALNHKTSYIYDRQLTLLPQVIRLRPAPHCRTPILSYSLKVRPDGHFLNWQQDPYCNYLARVVYPKPVRELIVEVDLIAEMNPINPFDFFVESSAERFPFEYDEITAKELIPYLEVLPAGPRLIALVEELRRDNPKTIDYLVEINQHLKNLIGYTIRLEPGIQSCEETLEKATGSCRDSAWLMVQVVRRLGMAARFASGYLIQLTADIKSLDGPSGTEKDFTDLHAWAEVYLPGAGWIGLDPTSGLLCGEGHIPLACTADPQSAAPITGAVEWEGEDELKTHFDVQMSVTRIHEDPRVTLPYTDPQWQEIEALGQKVDTLLHAGDVRLTMGGEPTFVAIDNRDAEEWNTAALGEHKRERAGVLFRRLRDRFAPNGLLHFGQGKWYPGESLPRWAFSCYWRKDGEPIWHNPELIAEDNFNYRVTAVESSKFIRTLADRLHVNPDHALPGYEDTWYYLWKERQLPINVDPLKNKLDDPEERRRLAAIFEKGLNSTVGYALPLRKEWEGQDRWKSGQWFLRREHLFLIPGDSPMGYRLPLDSLPWEAQGDRDLFFESDPGLPRPPLPTKDSRQRRQEASRISNSGPLRDGARTLSDSSIIRSALCVESRQGRLMVFMPPQRSVEDYLDLVEAIEWTAEELKIPVQIEGYKPPVDARLSHFSITPDPGVIEVNVQPASSWGELRTITHTVYEEAHQSRLSAEKFMQDGRHTGTGGGNHFIIGGATPSDSPLLRRPHLLRSLVSYWHNHPSLSYLFSGMFVGPTSQAPRVDEARNDSLYELEIALGEVRRNTHVTPWLVDRIFRHLLVDVTGNTHRAEFCIDKLYSPDSVTGRLGLLELRAFEMPPHYRMSLVQQLLLRSLVARFWEKPYEQKLVRWGTELHDRFMLPYFVQQDFRDLIEDLRNAGVPLKAEWFDPHYEFRFPQVGEIVGAGVALELRHAIEPWHVLGEESSAGGTARYVDSSLERMQVKVNGLIDRRHVIACNGRAVPLHPTGVNGEYVAGIRYRAWQPPSCLHPTIGVHSPLVFDVIDTWNNRAIAGCTYHVSHPGGRSFETSPVNSLEADGRRAARFLAQGHTAGKVVLSPETKTCESPFTLDLRK